MAALRDLGGAVDRTTKKEDKKKHKDCEKAGFTSAAALE